MMTRLLPLSMILLLLAPLSLHAEDKDEQTPVIVKIAGGISDQQQSGGLPAKITTAEEAEKYFEGEQLKKINKTVDWKRQTVLLFTWSGSGGDSMSEEIIEGEEGPKVVFKLKGGARKDLPSHAYIYAIRKGVPYEFKPFGSGTG